MNIRALFLLSLAIATGAAQAADNDWRLRIRKEADGWTASFSGPQEYGPSGKGRIKGSGVMVDKARALTAPFTKLRVDGPMDVRLAQGTADAVKVSADDNIEPLIETKVEGDTLILRIQPNAAYSTRRSPVVQVDAKSLQQLQIRGSGDVSMEKFKGDGLTLNLSGSGDLRIGQVDVSTLTATLNGSGDVRIAGRADQQVWTLHGSGDVDARSLAGKTVSAQLHGSGDLDLGTSEKLDVEVHGSGDVSYAGRPQVKQSVHGSGDVSRR